MARRLIAKTSSTHAFGKRQTRYEPPLDQPTSGISRLIAQVDDTGARRIEFFLHVAIEKIERLV